MPYRKTPLVSGEYYHIFNRTQNKEPVFVRKSDSERAIKTLNYYRFENPPVKLSYFLSFGQERRNEIFLNLAKASKIVSIITYCLMPNHFHLVLRQEKENGISRYLALFQNSFTKYRNVKYSRDGHLFKGQFKAVRIEDDDQFLHVHRYVHLNPYSSFTVRTISELEDYSYSSLKEYLNVTKGFCEKEKIMTFFPSLKKYKNFIYNQADYQRKLELIKHLVFE